MQHHKLAIFAFACGLISLTAVVHADHNSIWGEGWANMPNDIHNTRIETMDDEIDSFIDFVRMGSGAESVNPYLSDTDTAGGNEAGGGSRSQAGTRGGRS